jgi:AraC-like DNA-binding protein
VESLWRRSGLPPRALDDPESLISLSLGARFFDESSRIEGIENLGLLIGEHSDVSFLGTFGTRIAQSLTLYDAIHTAIQIQPGWNSGIRYMLFADQGFVRLVRQMRVDVPPAPQFDLAALSIMINLVRAAAGRDWRPADVYLPSLGEADVRNSAMLSEARIHYARSLIGLRFPSALLSRRLEMPLAPPGPGGAGEQAAWRSSSPPRDFAGSVRELVRTLVEARSATVGSAAEAAGMSLRTFQRRLTTSGLSYSRVLDEVRFTTACRLLGEANVKVAEIAGELGFSDPAHFTRAFRRWSSVSPLEYRRQRWLELETGGAPLRSTVHPA